MSAASAVVRAKRIARRAPAVVPPPSPPPTPHRRSTPTDDAGQRYVVGTRETERNGGDCARERESESASESTVVLAEGLSVAAAGGTAVVAGGRAVVRV